MAQQHRVLMVATSYPLAEDDWQGLFIRKIADVMGSSPAVDLALWAPDGPRHEAIEYACSPADSAWLAQLAERGGMAHMLRSSPVAALGRAGGLLKRLRALYKGRVTRTDIFHIIERSRESYFVVVDHADRMKGVISFQDIRNLLSEHTLDYLVIAQDLVAPDTLTLKQSVDLEEAYTLFGQSDFMLIPVVDSVESRKVVGVLRRADLIDYYNKRLIERLRQ